MLAIVLAAALAATAPPQTPDPRLTPGVVNPAATVARICRPNYTARPGVRHVTAATKRAVFAAYGLQPHGAGAPFEIDHLISLELGGANDRANLWPQSYVSAPWNAHLKDQLENRLHALVCAGHLPLDVAQHAIATDWVLAFRTYVTVASGSGARRAPAEPPGPSGHAAGSDDDSPRPAE